MMRAAVAFLLLLGGALPVWSAAGAPAWVNNLEHDFPNAKYLASVGTGDTRKDAEAAAAAALAKRFTVRIQTDTASERRYLDLMKDDKSSSESENKFSQSVDLQANESLVNLRFSDPYTDASGLVSVVAYLERQPTAQIYRGLIAKAVAKSASLVDRAGSAGALLKFALLDSALVVEQNAARLLEQLRIIHPLSADSVESDVDVAAVSKARDAAAAQLTYSLDISGDNGSIASLVQSSLSTLSLSANPSGVLHLKGSWSVVPTSGNPKYQSVQWTVTLNLVDESGSAVASISKTAKESGLTMDAAQSFAAREVGKFIDRTLPAAVTDYLTRLVKE